MLPFISIIIPLHNKGLYVERTLKSVQNQTFIEWEAIVIENNSSDNGPNIVANLSKLDQRIRLVFAPQNVCGPGAARNQGIIKASGKWILFLDADDCIGPNYLHTQCEFARLNPEAQIVVGSWVNIDERFNAITGIHRPACWLKSAPEVNAVSFAVAPWVVHAAIVRTDWLLPLRMWPEELDSYNLEDVAFWFSATLSAKIIWSESEDSFYYTNTLNTRNDSENINKTLISLQRAVEVNMRTLLKYGFKTTPKMYESLIRTFESYYRASLKLADRNLANSALDLSNKWLDSYDGFAPTMMLRKILGIKFSVYFSERFRRFN